MATTRSSGDSAHGRQGLQVVFGTGPVAGAVADALIEKGLRVRMVNRSGRLPAAWPEGKAPGVEIVSADAMDLSAALKASAGASHIYHCLHAPYNMWSLILPTLYGNLISASKETGAVLAIAQNLYMYARGVSVINEEARVDPPSRKGRLIQRLQETVGEAGARAGLRWTTIRASDFYGPLATEQSFFGTARFLDPMFAGKRTLLIGDIDQPHTYTYVGDYGRALAIAALNPDAHGQAWIVPNDRTRTTREVAEMFFRAAGRPPRINNASRAALFLYGLFNPVVREIPEVLYQKEEPYVVDGARFALTFGLAPTPLEEGVRRTLAWYRERSAGKHGQAHGKRAA